MISQVAAHAETFVISLLPVSFIGKEVNASADVKVADTAGVGEIESLINRVSYAAEKVSAQDGFDGILVVFPETLVAPLVFVILGIAIYTDIGAEAGFRCQSGRAVRILIIPLRADEPYKTDEAPFDYFYLFDVF